MKEVGLKDRGKKLPRAAFRRRAAAGSHRARRFAKNPKLLLCDEPTGALDYTTGKSILKLLHDTCRQKGMTVVVITHNLAVAPIADKLIRIKSGRVDSVAILENPVPIEEIEW